jgi:Zn-dependent M32 family carboxypeptidase
MRPLRFFVFPRSYASLGVQLRYYLTKSIITERITVKCDFFVAWNKKYEQFEPKIRPITVHSSFVWLM